MCSCFENKYSAVKFNYHANMMKDDFVHFHVIPRYNKNVERHGIIWGDHDWPLTEKMTKTSVDFDILLKIKEEFLKTED